MLNLSESSENASMDQSKVDISENTSDNKNTV